MSGIWHGSKSKGKEKRKSKKKRREKKEEREKEKKREVKIEKKFHGQVDMLTTVRATERNRSRFLTKVVCTIAL
jgi:hypothetical protein